MRKNWIVSVIAGILLGIIIAGVIISVKKDVKTESHQTETMQETASPTIEPTVEPTAEPTVEPQTETVNVPTEKELSEVNDRVKSLTKKSFDYAELDYSDGVVNVFVAKKGMTLQSVLVMSDSDSLEIGNAINSCCDTLLEGYRDNGFKVDVIMTLVDYDDTTYPLYSSLDGQTLVGFAG